MASVVLALVLGMAVLSSVASAEQPPYPGSQKNYLPANQLRLLVRDLEETAAAVPVGQHPALAAPAIDFDTVHARPVRVPMDEPRHAVLAERRAHRGFIDVHDLRRLRLDHFLALLAQPLHGCAA